MLSATGSRRTARAASISTSITSAARSSTPCSGASIGAPASSSAAPSASTTASQRCRDRRTTSACSPTAPAWRAWWSSTTPTASRRHRRACRLPQRRPPQEPRGCRPGHRAVPDGAAQALLGENFGVGAAGRRRIARGKQGRAPLKRNLAGHDIAPHRPVTDEAVARILERRGRFFSKKKCPTHEKPYPITKPVSRRLGRPVKRPDTIAQRTQRAADGAAGGRWV